jgi:Effector Associated Constant Component 1
MATALAVLHASFNDLDPGHTAAQAGIGELFADLKDVPELRASEHETGEGDRKGVASELLVSLGTPGAIAGLVRIVRLWLSRDRRRSLTVTIRDTADGTSITVAGDHISTETLASALDAATKPDSR